MITPILRTDLDEKWDDCWPVSTLRPLAMLDILSYVFFVKKIFDKELIHNKYPGKTVNNFIYSEDLHEFTWSNFRNLDARQIHDLFTGEHGIVDLMRQYGNSGSVYSEFFKAPPLLTPTARLLFNVIQIINIIETSDKNIQAAISDYLINKVDVIAQNGQVYLPENIAWLMVEVADPDSKDIIVDPSAGNGSLLINAARHLTNKNDSTGSEFRPNLETEILKGLESYPVQIRIAGFNMILQGIENPRLEFLDVLSDKSLRAAQKANLVISNLFFTEAEGSLPAGTDSVTGISRKDIFFLNLILKNIMAGARAVVLVPEFFLFSNDTSVTDIRREIIDKNKLEGVISLPAKSNSIISRAGILIFNKHQHTTTENVWFFKMKPGKVKEAITGENPGNNMRHNVLDFSKSNGVNDLLYQWKNRKSGVVTSPDTGYYVTANDIVANNYILNFDDYKTIAKKREAEKRMATEINTAAAPANKYPENNIEENFTYRQRRPKRKVLSAVIVLLLIAVVATGIYFYNFKNPVSSLVNTNEGIDSISNNSDDDTFSHEKSPGTISKIQTPAKKIATDTSAKNNNYLSLQSNLSKKYSVIDTAYFYKTADATERKKVYLIHRDNYVLHPTKDQNGFVYIIYINKKGESTRGWINKNDLQPVQ